MMLRFVVRALEKGLVRTRRKEGGRSVMQAITDQPPLVIFLLTAHVVEEEGNQSESSLGERGREMYIPGLIYHDLSVAADPNWV